MLKEPVLKKVSVDKVKEWAKNPRNIKTKDFERLKKQIQELGVYKPLVCYKDGSTYITLGGNMRLRALRELGIKQVDVSIVEAETEAEKIKYSLSDNDRAGEYDEQALAELVYPHIEEIELEDFKVDLGEPVNLKLILNDFADMGLPSKEDWANAFDEEGIKHLADDMFGIKFILPLKYKQPLLAQIKKHGNKNKFLMSVLDEISDEAAESESA